MSGVKVVELPDPDHVDSVGPVWLIARYGIVSVDLARRHISLDVSVSGTADVEVLTRLAGVLLAARAAAEAGRP